MFGLWAVARHTFRQCLRMKIAALFIILLVVGLAVLPFWMKGDGTLAGRIRTFLIYGTSMTAALLSLVTIFLAAGVVSSDVRDKQIFSVATKPLARWQYIVGRWLGLTMLNAILLAMAAGAIYGLAQYLRSGEALNDNDRRAVETEVFTARKMIPPEPLKVKQAVEARVKTLKDQGQYAAAVEAYTFGGRVNETLAEVELLAELIKQVSESMQSVAPNRAMVWNFSGIEMSQAEIHGTGQVVRLLVDKQSMVIKADPSLIGQFSYAAPVQINGTDGKVEQLGPQAFAVRLPLEEMTSGVISTVKVGDTVKIVADPIVQIIYTATPSRIPHDNILACYWEVQNPTDGFWYRMEKETLGEVRTTLTVSGRVVDKDGKTVVRYVNTPKRSTGFETSVTILHQDVALLYKVGGFNGNFIRGMLLVFVQLAFLAALGVLAGSFVSFPVACLMCFSVLPFQVGRGFILEAVSTRYAGRGFFGGFCRFIVWLMNRLLPDFSRTLPGDRFVEGMNISWKYVGETSFWALCVQTGLVLVIACLVFRKRELARVQV